MFIQTYNPDNYAIVCSKENNYKKFYNGELHLRKSLNYPPFCDIILIRVHSKFEKKVKEISSKIYNELLKQKNENLYIYKPVPSPIDKIQNVYRWRIVVKGRLNKKAIATINTAIKPLYDENKLKDVTIVIDSNPNSMM